MQHLSGDLFKSGNIILNDLKILVADIPSPKSGRIIHSGIFNTKITNFLEPGFYQFALADHGKIDIKVKTSRLIGGNRAVFFTVEG